MMQRSPWSQSEFARHAMWHFWKEHTSGALQSLLMEQPLASPDFVTSSAAQPPIPAPPSPASKDTQA
jgi:hypothetical protein